MKVLILGAPRSGSNYLYNVVTKYYANFQARNRELYNARNELLYVDKSYIVDTLQSHVEFTSYMKSRMTADIKKQYDSQYNELGFTENNINHMLKHIHIATQQENAVFKEHIISLENAINNQPTVYNTFVDAVDYTILLLRQNIFEASLSAAIAYVKQDYRKYEYTKSDTIKFTKDEFLVSWNAHYINYKKLLHNTINIPINEVVYYEDFKNQQPIDVYYNLKLCNKDYDDLPIFGSQVSKAPSKQDLVENYDELEEYAHALALDNRFADLEIKNHMIQVKY